MFLLACSVCSFLPSTRIFCVFPSTLVSRKACNIVRAIAKRMGFVEWMKHACVSILCFSYGLRQTDEVGTMNSDYLVSLLFTTDSFKFAWVKLSVRVNEPLLWLKLLVRHVDRLSCKWCGVCSPPNAVFSAPSYCGGCISDADGTSGQP